MTLRALVDRVDRVDRAAGGHRVHTAAGAVTALGDGRVVCNDHRDSASVQGAMVSGRRAAASVRRWLASARS